MRYDFHAGTTGHSRCDASFKDHRCPLLHEYDLLDLVSGQVAFPLGFILGTVGSNAFIEYCKALQSGNPDRSVFVIVDGHPFHGSKKTEEWVRILNIGGSIDFPKLVR